MNGIQIRVGDLVYAVMKRWKIIVVFVLLGCGFGAALSGISYMQGNYANYRISCSIAVTSQSATGNFTGNSSYLNPNDFYLAQDMVDAVSYVMKSDRVIEEAVQKAGIVSSQADGIAKNMEIARYNETQIIEVSLKWNDAQAGVQLMNAILDVSREVLPETLMVGSVSTIDAPRATYLMGMGSYSHIWLITGVLGFLIGAGMAILELIMRPTLLNLKDVEDLFGLETMGVIPNDPEYFSQNQVLLEREDGQDSPVRQNFTSAAYILQNRFGGKEQNISFYVTSAEDGEGKSTVAANLAIQLSDMEKKVLLIDLNTRNPALGSLFLHTVDYSRTLNALYKGETDVQEAVISLTGYLDLLPFVLERNAVPMDGQVFDLIRELKKSYDYIILDAPSVGQVSDVLSLNQVAEAVLFVIRYDDVPLPSVQRAIDKLDKSGIRILGCVVNAVQKRGVSYFAGERGTSEVKEKKEKKTPEETETLLDTDDDWKEISNVSEPMTMTPKSEEKGNSFDRLLDELTDDLLTTRDHLSDQEAIEALIQRGIDGSRKKNSQEESENEQSEQSETQMEDGDADTKKSPEREE